MIAAAIMAGGCVMSRNASQPPEVEDGSDDLDGGDRDADGMEDGGDEPMECFDRGTYNIDGVAVRGLAGTCDGDFACVEGRCEPLPVCAAGVHAECLFTAAPEHGEVKTFQLIGDYVYWVEPGTLDDLQNYRYDGVLARAKVGTWGREEIESGLDFYKESTSGVLGAVEIVEVEGMLVVQDALLQETTVVMLDGSDPRKTKVGCVAGDGTLYYRAGSDVHAVDLRSGVDSVLTTAITTGECVLGGDGYLWWYTYTDGRISKRERIARGTGAVQGLQNGPDLPMREDGERLFARRAVSDRTFFSVTPIASPTLTWQNLAGGTKFMTGHAMVGDHVVWSRQSKTRKYAVVLRGSLTGSGGAEVIAELPEVVSRFTKELPTRGELMASPGHAAWYFLDHRGEPGALHYFPLLD
jgi:hypothetical protein